MVQKGNTAFEALSRITASTWDPSIKHSQLLYTAVVRPTMLYGSQVWGLRDDGALLAASLLKPLKCIQNRCLCRVMGAYKRTPIAALEQESGVQPMDLHMEHKAMQRTLKTASHPVSAEISQVANTIWASLRRSAGGARTRRRQGAAPIFRPFISAEGVQKRATERSEEVGQLQMQGAIAV